jgi:hypothetical protein
MKKVILMLAVVLTSFAATIPQFFYYSDIRRAIAIRDTDKGIVFVKDRYNATVLSTEYPANTSRWISVSRLAPGQYTAQTISGISITFYKRP